MDNSQQFKHTIDNLYTFIRFSENHFGGLERLKKNIFLILLKNGIISNFKFITKINIGNIMIILILLDPSFFYGVVLAIK